jgi:hypothetical protein
MATVGGLRFTGSTRRPLIDGIMIQGGTSRQSVATGIRLPVRQWNLKAEGTRQVTDAHLLALAIARAGVLATFDGGIAEIVPDSASAAATVHVIAT